MRPVSVRNHLRHKESSHNVNIAGIFPRIFTLSWNVKKKFFTLAFYLQEINHVELLLIFTQFYMCHPKSVRSSILFPVACCFQRIRLKILSMTAMILWRCKPLLDPCRILSITSWAKGWPRGQSWTNWVCWWSCFTFCPLMSVPSWKGSFFERLSNMHLNQTN